MEPLVYLYKNTDEEEYCALSPYIKSIGEDVKDAVKNCFDEEDEKKLYSRLPVLTEGIDRLQEVLLVMRTGEKEYVPFQILDIMNHLE